jgi:uncharacterized protein Yka (UPF0111/DUF47 family)
LSEKALLKWFETRRESVIVKKTREHIGRVVETATEFNNAMSCLCIDDKVCTKKSVERLQISEKEADDIEDRVFEELSRGELPYREREDLMHLIKRSDLIADWIKEASRDMSILVDANIEMPKDISEVLREMSDKLSKACKALKQMMDNFGKDNEAVAKYESEVDILEHEMDDTYFKIKRRFISSTLDAKSIIIINDLLHAIENAADNCKNTAGMIHALVVASI